MSLIARFLEARGMPTLCLGGALDIIEAGKPPRAVFIDYPLGQTTGRPFDSENQRAIIFDALKAFSTIDTPGTVVHLDYRWPQSEDWKNEARDSETGDVRSPRGTEPQYQTEADRLAAEAH